MIDPPHQFDSDLTQELVRQAGQGDEDAWHKLYNRHKSLLRLLVHGRIPNRFRGRFDTEDVIAEGYLSAYEKISTYEDRGEASFKRWITQILINKLNDRLRHEGRAKRDPEREDINPHTQSVQEATSTESPSVIIDMAERQADVLAALYKIPDDEHDIVYLKLFEKLDWPEIAQRIGASESTARRRWTDAIAHLVAKLV